MKSYFFKAWMIVLGRARFFVFRKEWKRKYHDSFTQPCQLMDIDRISIGRCSYGSIEAISWGAQNESLSIGAFVSIARNVVFILGGNHDSGRISSYPFKAMLCGATIEATSKGPIVVEDDVWIGMNSIVLSGVRLARGSVIGAGSVVTKDTEPYSINCGNPARLVRKRFDDALIGELMRIDYGRISESFIKSNLSLLYGDVSVDSIRKIIELYS